jgi:hypothetical protein
LPCPINKIAARPLGSSFDARLVFKILIFIFEDTLQVTIKCEKQVFVFDGVSRQAQCSDLLSMLGVRMGVTIPGSAQLIKNGRCIGRRTSIEEVRQIVGQVHFEFLQY